MNDFSPSLRSVGFALILGVALLGCGGSIQLSPQVVAHLDEYENLIDRYEPRFRAAAGNPPEIARVADSYSKEAKAWMSEWSTVAPDPSEEEGRAIKARIDELNKRAVRMLTRG